VEGNNKEGTKQLPTRMKGREDKSRDNQVKP
jgi:hypothetical protein